MKQRALQNAEPVANYQNREKLIFTDSQPLSGRIQQ